MAKSLTTVSLAEIRRRVTEAQGYAARSRKGTAAELLATVQRLGCVQLDSISTVERSHRIALGARIGAYPEAAVSKLMREGRIFEYWAHEACLVPIEDYRMHRWRMAHFAESHPWRGNVFEREPELTAQVLREIAERGPLASRHFEGKGSGGMWNWKPAKVVLEALHSAGRLVIAGRENFQRLYDLPERIVPAEHLNGRAPTRDEYVRWATLRGVRARGALTEAAVAEMWRLGGGAAGVRPHADALVAEGLLRKLDVEDGKAPVLVPADAEPGGLAAAVGAPLPVRQPRLGPHLPRAGLRLPSRDRGLQARARAGLRLLRPAAPAPRPPRRPRRPEARPRRGRAPHQGLPPGARQSGATSTTRSTAAAARLARVLGAERVVRS